MEHKSAKIITNKETVTKIFGHKSDFDNEARGLELVSGVKGAIEVAEIVEEELTITYRKATKLEVSPDNLHTVLAMAAVIIDNMHRADLTHGDYYIHNLMWVEDKHGPELRAIDFETTRETTDEQVKGKDIINFLEYLLIELKPYEELKAKIAALLEHVSEVITKTVTFLGKPKIRTSRVIRKGIVGNFALTLLRRD